QDDREGQRRGAHGDDRRETSTRPVHQASAHAIVCPPIAPITPSTGPDATIPDATIPDATIPDALVRREVSRTVDTGTLAPCQRQRACVASPGARNIACGWQL